MDTSRYVPYLLALLRIVAGLLFASHGLQKLLGVPAPMANVGIVSMFSMLWFAAVLEVAGGAMLIAGLFTRPVAFILSGEMAVAYWMAHAPRSPFPVLNGGDAAILYCFVFLFLAAAGAGALSLDRAMRRA